MSGSGHSPASKRSKVDSPIIHHTPLALPGSSWKSAGAGSSSTITPAAGTTTTTTNPGSTIAGSTGAQIPPPQSQSTSNTAAGPTGGGTGSGSGPGGAGVSGSGGYGNPNRATTDVHSPPDDRPAASGSGSMGGAGNVQTDFDAINDAVGISGVDIAAEEELARQQSTMYGRGGGRSGGAAAAQAWPASHHSNQQQPPPRVKIMDFLDKPALTVMVQHIAASYQLKTLEPAILDVLTQAAEQRIHSLLIDAIAAKEHRVGSSHLRPPPLYTTEPTPTGAKGKQRERECGGVAMYDQVVYDEPERLLSMLARVEGEEERAARLARAGSADGEPGEPPPPPPAEPARGSGADVARKERKRKREGPGQQAKNMSEDARARQSNQTAMRSVGGRTKYSWLSGGAVTQPRAAPASTTAIMAALPAPKFAPQRAGSNGRPAGAGPGGSIGTGTRPAGGVAKKEGGTAVTGGGVGGPTTGRLGGVVPGAHLASIEEGRVGLRDCVFALERERGSGAGRGSGSRSLFKTYVIGRVKE